MNFLKKRAAARAQPELAEHVSQCARSAELTESDRQALFHTPPVYTRDCPDCGTRFESQCARSAKCPQCLSLSLSLSLNALEAQSTAAESAPNTTQGEGGDSPLSSAQSSGVAAEADDGAAEPFAELASWTTADLVQWIGDRHDNGAALAALDEACQALPDDVRPEVEKRITEAYTFLARDTLADIASQCARSADELRDLDEEKEAIVEALTRWQESVPGGDELLELVQVRRPGYFALEDLGAALVELQQANVLAVGRTGGWYLTAEATPTEADSQPQVTFMPSATGTVIARIRSEAGNSYRLISGPYQLDLKVPTEGELEALLLVYALLSVVDNRLWCFQNGEFRSRYNAKALGYLRAAMQVISTEIGEFGADPDRETKFCVQDAVGPGGAHHSYELNWGLKVQFQRGPRAEVGSVSGVLDPDIVKVALDILTHQDWSEFRSVTMQLLEQVLASFGERVADRILRDVFGKNAA